MPKQQETQFSRELGAVDTVYLYHAQGVYSAMLQLAHGNKPQTLADAAVTVRFGLSDEAYQLIAEAIKRGGKGNSITTMQYRAALAALGLEDEFFELVGRGNNDENPPTTEGS